MLSIAEYGDREAYYSLGVSIYEKVKYPEALKVFKIYINRIKPHSQSYYDAHHNSGLCFFEMGHYPQAINTIELALLRDESDVDAKYNLALAYIKNGNDYEAL